MKDRRNICIIPSWYPTSDHIVDGIFIKEQAEALSEIGHKVSVLYVISQKQKGKSKISYSKEHGVHTFILNALYWPKILAWSIDRWASNYFFLMEILVQEIGKPDLLHAHGYVAGFAARRISQKWKVPYVLTEHNSNIVRGTERWWHKKEIKKTYHNATQLVAVSQLLKKAMQKRTKHSVIVIPNFVNQDIFYPGQGTKADRFEFITVGGLVKNKRIEKVIDAFYSLINGNEKSECILRIVGSGERLNMLQKQVREKGLEKMVHFEKAVSHDRVAVFMQIANALVTVSETETFGKVIIESLASGTPVLTAESADPENIVIDGINGMRIDSELKQLPQAMFRMVEFAQQVDPNDLHQKVFQNFGKKTVLKKIVAVYETVISTHNDTTHRPTE